MKNQNDFCVFILTHGRPQNVITWNTLKKSGYSGRTLLVIDNEDSKADEYYRIFGTENVIMFDKKAVAQTIDEFDNFDDRRAIVYARNACFDIAEELGYEYFLQLDDDYINFEYRMRVDGINSDESKFSNYIKTTETLGRSIEIALEFFKSVIAKSVAFSQGGDWMDGTGDGFSRRKAMNTFFCSTKRRFDFVGRINEDVNTYTWIQSQGGLFLTLAPVKIVQKQTQTNRGGMSDIYLANGTYVKSFYTVICSPSCVDIKIMGSSNRRIHHRINWPCAVPQIVPESLRKNKERPKPEPPPRKKILPSIIIKPDFHCKPNLALLEQKPSRKKCNPKVTKSKSAPKPKKEFSQDYWKDRGFNRPKDESQFL